MAAFRAVRFDNHQMKWYEIENIFMFLTFDSFVDGKKE